MVSPSEYGVYKEKLQALRKRVGADVTQLRGEALQNTGGEASGSLSNVPHHLADLANREFEEEITLGLVANEQRLLAEVDAALARMDANSYGVCTQCRKGIAKERLRALPYAPLCVDCARKLEKRGAT